MKDKNQQSVVQNSNLEQSKLPCRTKVISCINLTGLLMAEQNIMLHLLLQVYMK